jgi:alcohol dehydrogenase
MKALVLDDGLRFTRTHPTPQRGIGEALIRVRVAGVCSTDLELVRGYMAFRGVLGHEFVGEVVDGSAEWLGRRVVGEINCVCRTCDLCRGGLSTHCRNRSVLGIAGRDGAFAEYCVLPETNLHAVPENIPDEMAVFAEPLAAALQVLQQCRVDRNQHATVVGAGRLGLLVAQVLRPHVGSLRVLSRSSRSLERCDRLGLQSIGLEDVVPATDQDVVVDCSGTSGGLAVALGQVRPRGTLILKSTFAGDNPVNLAAVVINEINVVGSRCGPFGDALALLARGGVEVETLVTRSATLEDGVAALADAAGPDHLKVLLRP